MFALRKEDFLVAACGILIALTSATLARAHSGGMYDGYAGEPPNYSNCANCHGGGPGQGSISLTGLPSCFVPGETYHLAVHMEDPGQQSGNAWGFELTVLDQGDASSQAGQLIATDLVNTQLSVNSGASPDFLKQTSMGTFSGNQGPVSWNFDWTAPAGITTADFYLAGVGANGGWGDFGDDPVITSRSVSACAACVTPPVCLASWYPFSDPAGGGGQSFAADVMARRDLNWHVATQWTQNTPCGSSGWSADLTPSGNYLEAADNPPQHSFGSGSFSIFAWVNVHTPNNGRTHVIVDKSVFPSGGYLLYIRDGTLGLQLGANGHFSIYPGPPLSAGWHMVGASVRRSSGSFQASVYVDAVPITYNAGEMGNLDTAVQLRVGKQSPSFSGGGPFDGWIADLQIYKCFLTQNQVSGLYAQECNYARQQCYVPSVVMGYTGDLKVRTKLRIWNYVNSTTNFDWYISGIPASVCGTKPPVVFDPPSGVAQVTGIGFTDVGIDIVYPPGFSSSDAGCYQVWVENQSTGCLVWSAGVLGRYPWWVEPYDPNCCISTIPVLPAPTGESVMTGFRLKNGSDTWQTVGWELVGRSTNGDPYNQVVSLNGLPPGTPVTGTLSLAPGDSSTIAAQAVLAAFQPLNVNEVVLSIDWTGGIDYSAAAAVGLESMTVEQAAAVPSTPQLIVPVGNRSTISIAPNPFNERTGIRFTLASPQDVVRVGVFDVAGRLIRDVFSGPLAAGAHQCQWDGLDARGRKSAVGIYFIRVQASGIVLKTRVARVE
jgi:hypothetical protein